MIFIFLGTDLLAKAEVSHSSGEHTNIPNLIYKMMPLGPVVLQYGRIAHPAMVVTNAI